MRFLFNKHDSVVSSAPAPFTFGNLGRTVSTIRADAAKALDLSVFKSFRPIERTLVEFRAEAFNVFNHANFVGYNSTFGNLDTPNPAFGKPLTGITNQLPARSLQFMLRLLY